MKHVMLFSLAFLLLVGCAKEESFIELETVDPLNDAVELSVSELSKSGLKIEDNIPIFYEYFLNGDKVPVGDYAINDPSLWIQLTAKSGMKKGKEMLIYEFHAFQDQQTYFNWARNQGILAEQAVALASTLSEDDNNGSIANYFAGSGKLPQQYVNYVDELLANTRQDVIGTVEVAPVTTTLFENTINTSPPNEMERQYAPLLPVDLDNNVTSIQVSSRNMFFPTLLFEDEFFTTRVNPIIWNLSQKPVVFKGPLEECNDKISSVF